MPCAALPAAVLVGCSGVPGTALALALFIEAPALRFELVRAMATGLDGTPPPPLLDRLGKLGQPNCCCCGCCCGCPPEAFRSGVAVGGGAAPAVAPAPAELEWTDTCPDAAVRPLVTEFPGDGGGPDADIGECNSIRSISVEVESSWAGEVSLALRWDCCKSASINAARPKFKSRLEAEMQSRQKDD